MLEKILQEILEMEYPSEAVASGLEEAGITDRYMAAAYGFGVAKGMAQEVIQGCMSDTAQKGVGEDYRQRVMDRFCRVE